jgi:hypothetical protein
MAYLKTAPKRYFIEVMTALVLFFAAGWLRAYAPQHTTDPTLLLATKLLPIVLVLFIAIAGWRRYRSLDEFQRQTMLKTSAAAGALSLLILMLFPFLMQLGLPPLPQHFPLAVLVLCFSYMLCGLAMTFMTQRAEKGMRAALLFIAPVLAAFLLPLLYWGLTLVLPLPHITWRGGLFFIAAVLIALGFHRIFVRPVDL